jgi:hypothetical protein
VDQRIGRIVSMAGAVIVVCCMMAAAGPQKKRTGASAVLNKWFCLARDPVGVIVEYRNAKSRKSSRKDTCSSVWFHDRYGYKLYLKNGDSVRVCMSCVKGSRFLEFEKKGKRHYAKKIVNKKKTNKNAVRNDKKDRKRRHKKK